MAPPEMMNPGDILQLCSKLSPSILNQASTIAQSLASTLPANSTADNLNLADVTQALMKDPQTQTLFSNLLREIQPPTK